MLKKKKIIKLYFFSIFKEHLKSAMWSVLVNKQKVMFVFVVTQQTSLCESSGRR